MDKNEYPAVVAVDGKREGTDESMCKNRYI
jgi:hypothetical protein